VPLALAGCDAGEPTNQPEGVGAPVHFVANVGPDQPLPENGAIELTFDRLLMPASISRQTFQLSTLTSTGYQATTPAPTVGYDPVSRVVTIAPAAGTLAVGQTYQLVVIPLQLGVTYMQPEQAFIGVVAIDGATLDLTESDSGINGVQLAFQVTGAATQLGVLTVDYCSQINTIFKSCASGVSSCHSPPSVGMPPAQGLVLTEPTGVLATAIGQVAVEANTGPRPITQSPNVIFGLDMPVIDRGPGGGAAGNPSEPTSSRFRAPSGPRWRASSPGARCRFRATRRAPPARGSPSPSSRR
jgi:hypothetical protein